MPEFKDDNYRVVAHENVVGRFDRYIKTQMDIILLLINDNFNLPKR